MSIVKTPVSIDEYISHLPDNAQDKMKEMKETIKKYAPDAAEKISYGMPAFTLKGMLLYFAAHTNHIGFYPFTSAIEAFNKELAVYYTSKGTVQFSYDKPLPLNLIRKIVEFRVKENLEKANAKSRSKRVGK